MKNKTIHCLVLPFPAHGHINPMLEFSKLLVQHQEGLKVTLVTTLSNYNNIPKLPPNSITIETISDGFDKGGVGEAKSFKLYLNQFWQVGPQSLADLINNLNARPNYHVDCLIYDSFMPWCLDVAKRFGIVGATFLTQNLAMNSIYYHVNLGKLKPPFAEQEICLPALPQLQHRDMPSFYFTYEKDPTYLDLVVAQFSNIDKVDWILCNSFFELEKEVADWTMKIWSNFRTIGPSIPSTFLDKRIKDEDDGVAQFKSEECIEWLNNKPKRSVVYVSFGSMASLNEEQTEEVAHGLKDCGSYFLWVLKTSEETKLPKDLVQKSENGLVVTWCSQLKVLAHEAIGCFVTHCGWNSTLEALSLGVPIVAMPLWSDQGINAKFVVDVWKVGIRPLVDDKEIVRKDALKDCICEIIMESEKSKEIMNNVMQWKTMAARAMGEDGSSYKNIIEFVNSLFQVPTTN